MVVYQNLKAETESIISYGGSKRRLLPKNRRNLDTPRENMAAAIKYQGIRLHFFAAMFKAIDVVLKAQYLVY